MLWITGHGSIVIGPGTLIWLRGEEVKNITFTQKTLAIGNTPSRSAGTGAKASWERGEVKRSKNWQETRLLDKAERSQVSRVPRHLDIIFR